MIQKVKTQRNCHATKYISFLIIQWIVQSKWATNHITINLVDNHFVDFNLKFFKIWSGVHIIFDNILTKAALDAIITQNKYIIS